MLLNRMETETVTDTGFISSIKRFNDGKQHGTIKTLLKNFILSETDMAIKQNQNEKTVYTVPVNLSPPKHNERTKSINEAKLAFLNSTVNHTTPGQKNDAKKEDMTIHYAQIAIATGSDDTRSTGGGKEKKQTLQINQTKPKAYMPIVNTSSSPKKRFENQQRKVSFKTKSVSSTYRRPPIATKTMTINSTKVSELTKKFNDLQNESRDSLPIPNKLVKTIEDLATASRCSASNSSTPSSTLSSSPNIKIVLRQRRGSKKRNNRKRCSSVDSIDKLIVSENTTAKISVIRSKSDGTKIPKTSKKRLKYQESNEQQSGSDSVDGSPAKILQPEPKIEKKQTESNKVKNVIKKFECEIIAQSNTKILKTQTDRTKSTIPIKEKPKVPEKKSSLVVTKNVVVKDGIPKLKTIKPPTIEIAAKTESDNVKINIELEKRKEPIYDRKKFKTNYIHTEKMPLKVVEIIPEDINESNCSLNSSDHVSNNTSEVSETHREENSSLEVTSPITPNDSFLWRRKSTTQIYVDPEKSSSESPYCFISLTLNPEGEQDIKEKNESLILQCNESLETEKISESDPDFECNLVEAYNKDVLVGFTSKPKRDEKIEEENDYEPLEPKDDNHVVIIPIKSDGTSKINCPLPEIPKQVSPPETPQEEKENIYQCLLEMRSHPEGDESSLHNYEICENELEERTRGDGDSDDGYEYCKSPIKPYCLTSSSGIQIAEDYKPFDTKNNSKNYNITKSLSGTSTVSYEKIGSERIYEKIPNRSPKSKDSSPTYSSRHSFISDYNGYNDSENIYDTIKQSDGASLSHCYESIPNSPSVVKLRNNFRKQLNGAQKRLSFDTVSNISQSTMSSEQKTNSIYGQRSVISFNGQEIAFQVPSSEVSTSDRSDRSDDWVDVSDEEKQDEHKIIIVRERSRGRKSPISWSQKVRHQWQKSPHQKNDDKVSVTSPSNVYLDTTVKSPYYSRNDEEARRVPRKKKTAEDSVVFLQVLEQQCWLSIRTVLRDAEFEIQDIAAFLDCESSDSGHVYESLEPRAPPLPPALAHDDSDSFDSDTDTDDNAQHYAPAPPTLPASRLPTPPTGGQYTLTKIASAAQKKMKEIKRNLTKRYSVAMDGKPFMKSPQSQNGIYDTLKPKKAPIYANCERTEPPLYTNVNFNDTYNKVENQKNGFKDELKTVTEKRLSEGNLDSKVVEKPVTPTSEGKKDNGTLSRKTYFSFKSRFRRATSLAVDINDVPSALKITNSTFYLTDSMDGDSGFSNCSDSGQAGATGAGAGASGASSSTETLGRRRGSAGRRPWSESTPCLALERPTVPPPPPPPPAHHAHTDISAVNEELKRLLPTLSRKDKSPRARTSWYADCGADTTPVTPAPAPAVSNTSWYAEAGLYPAGNVSTSSGASSGSHPASPLPHSLFTHEPLYQFYNAAKVESVCRETGDSDSDAYEVAPTPAKVSTQAQPPALPPARPSAMALVAPRGPARTLWCEVPEVLNSAVLSSLAPAQKRLQEAKFELLTSEASYLNSLNVLEAHFVSHPAFRETHILPRADWETLFATILPVRKCSQLLMNELEKCWQESILLQGICDIVRRHAEQHFHVYVKYCENQALMVKTLQRLRDRPTFATALKRLESHPACQSLSLHSFLMLPMQRVTRLPLLLDAVLRHLPHQDQEYQAAGHALATTNHFVTQCNEGARNTERVEEMFRLCRAIEFPGHVRDAPHLAPAIGRRDRRPVRWLVRSGEMTQLIWKSDEMKLTFGKKFHKVPLYVFLFNDHLVITKKKGGDSYVAVDHCPRSLLEVCASDGGTAAAKHALLLTLLENHEGRTVEMLMGTESETEVSRWAEALSSPGAEAGAGEGEAVYAGWDCPQVCALYAYHPAQPDELPLNEGDVVNVTRKTAEGWYYGERTRDGEAGWFPGAYTAEIASPHVRARNLRQRYRLLALSGTYFGQRKKL